jgi:hypothetical protein
MYSYTYKGVIYTAKNLIDLQMQLEAAGYTGNVAEFFNQQALEQLQEEADIAQIPDDDLEEELDIANENLDVEIYDEKDRH